MARKASTHSEPNREAPLPNAGTLRIPPQPDALMERVRYFVRSRGPEQPPLTAAALCLLDEVRTARMLAYGMLSTGGSTHSTHRVQQMWDDLREATHFIRRSYQDGRLPMLPSQTSGYFPFVELEQWLEDAASASTAQNPPPADQAPVTRRAKGITAKRSTQERHTAADAVAQSVREAVLKHGADLRRITRDAIRDRAKQIAGTRRGISSAMNASEECKRLFRQKEESRRSRVSFDVALASHGELDPELERLIRDQAADAQEDSRLYRRPARR